MKLIELEADHVYVNYIAVSLYLMIMIEILSCINIVNC